MKHMTQKGKMGIKNYGLATKIERQYGAKRRLSA